MLPHVLSSKRANGFATSYDRLAARALDPGPAARLRAKLRPGALDRALIAGEDPVCSAALAARAAKLARMRTRAQIAEGLERSLMAARGPQRRWWAVPEQSPLRANATEVRELAQLLRADAPLYAPGIALVNQLLSDGTGPAYRGHPQHLALRLREAHMRMVGSMSGSPCAGPGRAYV